MSHIERCDADITCSHQTCKIFAPIELEGIFRRIKEDISLGTGRMNRCSSHVPDAEDQHVEILKGIRGDERLILEKDDQQSGSYRRE